MDMTRSGFVQVFSIGPFGEAVSAYLHSLRTDVVETVVRNSTLVSLKEGARLTVVAAWRPVSKVYDYLDDLSYQLRRPLVPLLLTSTLLQIGPAIAPGKGSCCWHCSWSRDQQHAPWPAARLALHQYYDEHNGSGPRGYLEPFAMMGAARISQIIEELDMGISIGGQIWQMDTLTGEVSNRTVFGLHDCPRCGLRRSAAERTFSEMRNDLSYLW